MSTPSWAQYPCCSTCLIRYAVLSYQQKFSEKPKRFSCLKNGREKNLGDFLRPFISRFYWELKFLAKFPVDRGIDVLVISLDKLIFCRFFCVISFLFYKQSAVPLSTDQRNFPFLSIFFLKFILLCLSIFVSIFSFFRFYVP